MKTNQQSATKWLMNLAREVKNYYIVASVLNILSAGSFVFFSWYLSEFAARWLTKDEINCYALLYAGFYLLARYIFAHFASTVNYKAGNEVVIGVKNKLYPRLLHNNQIDSVAGTLLVTKVSDDLKPFFAFFVPYAIASVVVSLLLLGVSFYFEVWVGIILLITFAVIPFQMVVVGLGAESLHNKHIHLFVKYSSVFYNRLSAVAEIVNLDNLKAQSQFLSKKSNELNKATTEVMRIAILSSAILELFVTIGIAGVAIFMGLNLLGIMPGAMYGKSYDFKIALFLLMLSPYFFFYLRKFVSAYHDRNKAVASANLIMPLLDVDEVSVQIPNTIEIQSLQLKNLNFAYPNAPIKVLNELNMDIPPKGIFLVKGISGSGKSTLLKILAGSLPLSEGSVSLNGLDNITTLQWLKLNSSYMNQFPFIFDGTLGYNVFLKNEIQWEQMTYPDFLNKIIDKKENKWETPLSHNGKQLSGGEKQLTTLARLILFPKPVAILDEPTANLDPDTTEIIIEQIKKLAKDRLVIIASHEDKFDTIADTTVELNWGEQL